MVTSARTDLDLSCLPAGIEIARRSSPRTTTFENLYHNGHRRQVLWAQAEVITAGDVPGRWSDCPIVHLGPVSQGVDPAIVDRFRHSLIGVTPQGWMRSWDDEGTVHPKVWEAPDALLRRADAVILSEEDVGGDMRQVEDYASQTALLVLTAGWKGSTVYYQGETRSFPAPPVREVDPTGAGDIFGTVYLTALHRTADPWLSAQFANCVAAHSVERTGMASIPTDLEIDRCRKRFGGLT
jgi:sugar/nucleoside kinase (ribokinase family)